MRPELKLESKSDLPQLNLFGLIGNKYEVEYCTNLAAPIWSHLLTITNLNADPYPFLDSECANQAMRFYRVRDVSP